MYFWVVASWIKGVLRWGRVRRSFSPSGLWSAGTPSSCRSDYEDRTMHTQRCTSKCRAEPAYLFIRDRGVGVWGRGPGSSLDRPFHGKRTHAAFLFGRGRLYEFITPFSGAPVQKSAPPCRPINWAYIYYFDLSFAGEWHQSGSSVRSRGCHPHSVSGRLPARAGFVISEEERQCLGGHN